MTAHHQNVSNDKLSIVMHELARSGTNANRWERIVSLALGVVVLLVGLRRRSLGGVATALIGGWLCYRSITSNKERHSAGVSADATEVERSITVGESADELYRFLREPQHFARIMGHFAEVTTTNEGHQHWVVPLPLGRLTWNAQIVEERPGELLRWESRADAALPNEGSVHFRPAPGDRGTEVMLRFRFDPPAGVIGDAAVKLLGTGPRSHLRTTVAYSHSVLRRSIVCG